ncbi:MAG TPA: NAD-dependent epimerase/dehydratase family protein [Syntrophomonadaceae bacterium]|nr:NAD-dependent epimerase/dehydratase family protein [Syntrophomonadaceae bacterium]
MAKVLVTGGAGFIASHITDQLVIAGYEVVVIDNLSSGRLENVHRLAKIYCEDICSPVVESIFKTEEPLYVIHHAAQTNVTASLKDPIYDAKVNIIGSINIFENCVKYSVQKVVYASSAAVYGEPLYLGLDEEHPVAPRSFYGLSKYSCEQYLASYAGLYGLNYAVLRYANVYGPRQRDDGEGGVVSIFTGNLLNKRVLPIYGSGEQTRDFVYVKDVVEANIKALASQENLVVNIGSGRAITVNHLYHKLAKLMDIQTQPIYAQARPGDILHSYFDISRAERCLGWKPATGLEYGLEATIQSQKSGGS